MAVQSWLLEETASGYRLGSQNAQQPLKDVAVPHDCGSAEIAKALQRALAEEGYRGEPVMFGVASSNCLAVTFPHAGRAMARNPQAMAYGLEEFLPLTAEEMSCDFVIFPNDALGVAVEVAALRPILTALKQSGARIASVVPTAMLALQGQIGSDQRRGRRLVVCQDGDRLDLFELIGGRPHTWRTFPATTEDLLREVHVLGLVAQESPLEELMAGHLSVELQETLRQVAGDVPVRADLRLPASAAVEAGAAIASGREEPWIELHRGELGTYDPYRPIRKSLRVFAAASACLLVAVSLAAWLRAGQYDAIAQNYQKEQEKVFRHALPGARVPIGIRSRLESEYQTLAGITGQVEGTPRLESAMVLLRDALVALPEDLRYRLLEVRAEQNHVYLDGEVRQHGDADLLATALRKSGFGVAAPRTEQLGEKGDKGIAVVITADRTSKDEKAGKQGGVP